jgi:hypothetical protein
MNASPALAVRNCIDTGVPFLINGRDSGYNVEIMLSNYSDDHAFMPEFGTDKEAHWELVDGHTIRVFFHPKTCYEGQCQYYLYVGIHHPRTFKSGKGCSGYDQFMSVKGKQIEFTGSFRFIDGLERNRKSFYVTPAYGYISSDGTDRKVCAFNNYGWSNQPLEQANMDHSERKWWHNIYWGTWYDESKIFPGGIAAASPWVNFNVDLNKASRKAEELARKKWPFEEPPHFKTDRLVLEQASVGPEYNAGDGSLVFEVKDLNLDIREERTR